MINKNYEPTILEKLFEEQSKGTKQVMDIFYKSNEEANKIYKRLIENMSPKIKN